jgi:nitrogen fixation/metabolism regulation signal transduction histidine kinase
VAARDAESARGATIAAYIAISILLASVAFYGMLQVGDVEGGAFEAARGDVLMLARAIESAPDEARPAELRGLVSSLHLDLAASVYESDGTLVSAVAAPGAEPLLASLPMTAPTVSEAARWRPVSIGDDSTLVLVVKLDDGRLVAVAHRARAAVSWVRTLVAAQALTILVAIGIAVFLIRRLRRAVQSRGEAQNSNENPVTGVARSEADLVVETFHSVIGELQVKGRELERKRIIERDRADRSEQFSESVIAQMPTGLVVVSNASVVTGANPSARDIFSSLPADRAQSVRFQDAFRDAPELVRMVEDCLNEGASFQRHEVEFRIQTGAADPGHHSAHDSSAPSATRCLGVSVSPLGSRDGRPEGALCIMTDLTEVVALRDRVRLRENLASLGEMAAGLTHELKNSLATIQGYSQLIARLVPGNAAGPSESLVEEVRYLSQMVTDFLNFARPHELHLVPVSIAQLVRDVVSRVEDRVEEASIALSIEIGTDAENASVHADETLLARALLNIVINAIEVLESAQEPRSLAIRVGVAPPGEAIVEIADNGPGIATDDLSKIFIPFFTTKSRGHGIGLALTQKIVLSHRGRLDVESRPSGTMFRSTLPLAPT